MTAVALAGAAGACRCRDVERLDADDALRYAEHLRFEAAAGDGWSATWRCPDTGAEWLEIHHVAWRREDPSTSLVRVAVPGAIRATPRATWTPARLITVSVSVLLVAAIAAGSFL